MSLMYIFLLVEDPKQLNNWSKLTGQFFSSIIILILILLLFYWASKFIVSQKHKLGKNSNMQIIESLPVGYQSTIQLVRVTDKTILIGVTKEKISFLCEVNSDNIKQINDVQIPKSFKDYLQNFVDKKDTTGK